MSVEQEYLGPMSNGDTGDHIRKENALPRSEALDAQFLIQATFGPTRKSLKNLVSMSYEDWIKHQIEVPVSSHREHYRSSVNPAFLDSKTETGYFSEVAPCSKGSRWVGHVFKKSHVGSYVQVRNGKIEIAGMVVSDIDPSSKGSQCDNKPDGWMTTRNLACKWLEHGDRSLRCQLCDWKEEKYCQQTCWDKKQPYTGDDCSGGWAQYLTTKFSKHLCSVEESIGGMLLFGDKACKKTISMLNPAVWVSDSAASATETSLGFEMNPSLPSVQFLSDFSGKACDLVRDKALKIADRYFTFEPRVALLTNTPHTPDTSNVKSCVDRNFLNEKSCVMADNSSSGCPVACGSIGEVGSVSAKGHQYSMVTKYIKAKGQQDWLADTLLDSSSRAYDKGKEVVWTMKALYADDQLRQRMAWALSQILVIGVPGLSALRRQSETFMNFYDIFVRNAFGNYRDILKEVTYNPVMGMYLSYANSRSYDSSRTYPDENYAREIMQLFSIGVDLLYPNGSVTKDATGVNIPAYTNENIMDFARVFTGFFSAARRGNIEQAPQNTIDPMIISSDSHDKYPKPALDQNFLGDGFPLCADLPKHAFLAKGARYDFLGHSLQQDAFELEAGSALRFILAELKQTTLTLQEKVACFSKECSLHTLNVVKIGTAFYEYVAPTCVHLFFSNGSEVATTRRLRSAGIGNDMTLACGKGYKLLVEESYITSECGLKQDVDLYTSKVGKVCNNKQKCVIGWNGHGRKCKKCKNVAVSDPCPGKHKLLRATQTCLRTTTKEAAVWKQCVDPNFPVAGFACSKGCTDIVPNHWAKKDINCENQEEKQTARMRNQTTNQIVRVPLMYRSLCNKNSNWRKWKFCTYTCWKNSPAWNNELAYENIDCSAGKYQEEVQCDSTFRHMSFTAAEAHCKSLGMSVTAKPQAQCAANSMNHWTGEACDMTITVHGDGKVSAHTSHAGPNKFSVQWDGGKLPAAKDYAARVHMSKVFTTVPSKQELLATLKIGAFPPEGNCTPPFCEGDVIAYMSEGGIDENTIFESNGRFFKNVQSVVHVDSFSFRNPPVFIKHGPSAELKHVTPENPLRTEQRAAAAEVDSLIDHIFHHPNTPANIGFKLIQRFTSSSPSGAYIEAVANAFKTGAYGGLTFSRKWGDLAATVAAILLHPEARAQNKATDGLLREPMLKLMHFMRAMEYEDWSAEPIVMKKVDEDIGQFPYHSPTVFNFFNADFMPSGLSKTMRTNPEPEPEPEPYAPEFQIFTPPFVINLLNGFTSLVEWGLSECGGGLGRADDLDDCQRGALNYSAPMNEGETVNELDVLLTGGRLTTQDAELVKAAYDKAESGKKTQAAQTAILLTPEFNNLGKSQFNGSRAAKVKTVDHELQPYKALVVVFLAGGADTYQMLVPRDCSLHDSYAKVRAGINMRITDLLAISTPKQNCTQFGVNKNMPRLHQMYLDKEAAFISNVGSLVEPINANSLKGGAIKQCPSQFSHSHAQAAAQTMQCALSGKSPMGTGGLMAEELAKKNMNVALFSVAGVATWSQAQNITMDILDKNRGALRFGDYNIWHDVIDNISSQRHSNAYCDNYAEAFGQAIKSSETLGTFLEAINSSSLDNYKTGTTLAKQLHQVARIIKTREARKAERDFFFVQLGGWDTHAGILSVLPQKFNEVDNAVADFVAELKTQKVFDSVVLVTQSDFGRTLSSNGQGTDHGWGGNHIIVGGKVNGGEVYNEFLETYELGGAYDAGRGRSIPKYPWESMMVPIAEWVGVDDMDPLFPNLGNFNRSTHIISRSVLFKS